MRAELSRILAGERFRSSQRRARLLQYLVDKALAGEQVKEYTVGVDVFGKPVDYDPRLDAVVRVEMGRVRARLSEYYAAEGRANPARLEFPPRTYAPVVCASPGEATAPNRKIPFIAAGVVLGVLFLGAAWRFSSHWTPRVTVNPQALEVCARARFFWDKRTPEALRTSLALYQEAIRLAPRYAPAYAGEALSYAVMATNSELPAARAGSQAIESAKEAIVLDGNLAEAHAALGLVACDVNSDWKTADGEFVRALQLDPKFASAHQWRALCLLYMGRTSEALSQIRNAVELAPASLQILTADGMVSYYSRRYDETIAKARALIEMDPSFREAHLMLGQALEQRGEWADAEREFRAVALASTGDSEGLARLAHLYARTGRRKQAEEIVGKLLDPQPDQYVDPYQLAFIYTALDQKPAAFEWLEKAIRQHSASIMRVDPYLDPLRKEPEFQRELAEAHLQ